MEEKIINERKIMFKVGRQYAWVNLMDNSIGNIDFKLSDGSSANLTRQGLMELVEMLHDMEDWLAEHPEVK